jgi:flagellar hook-associated protein 3 FlgL
MSVSAYSTLGLELTNLQVLSSGQAALGNLSTQLTTQKKSEDLADYSTSDAQNILNDAASLASQNSYLSVINTISARVSSYDTTLTSMESTMSTISSALTSAQTYNSSSNASLTTQITSALQSVGDYLNTTVDGKYIFSGSRYTEAPVTDLTALPVPPTDTVVTSPTLPVYDADYTGPGSTSTTAWTQNQISIDDSNQLTYGVTSTQKGFQELILGLRWAYAATQDPTNYTADMTTARNLMTAATNDIQSIHTSVSNSSAMLSTTQSTINTTISNLQTSKDALENVDTNQVSVEITTYQSTLEASYAAVAVLAKLSIVQYLT